MLASIYTDDFERGNAMGIALGGLALGVLSKDLWLPGVSYPQYPHALLLGAAEQPWGGGSQSLLPIHFQQLHQYSPSLDVGLG